MVAPLINFERVAKMNNTDYIETAVLQEIEKYECGTFSDYEIVMIQVEAVETCPVDLKKFIAEKFAEKEEGGLNG